jgi:single-strand DNA-binding protein
VNRLTVIGRIVREIELREVGDGKIVMNNAVAIPRTFKTNKGPDADFVDIVAWGKRAEVIEEYCDKGDLVGLDGRLQSRTYVDNNQQTVYVVEMIVESVHFLQQRGNQRKGNQQNNRQGQKNIQTANGPQQIEPNR